MHTKSRVPGPSVHNPKQLYFIGGTQTYLQIPTFGSLWQNKYRRPEVSPHYKPKEIYISYTAGPEFFVTGNGGGTEIGSPELEDKV